MTLLDRQSDPKLSPELRERARALLQRDECAGICGTLDSCLRDGFFDPQRTEALNKAIEKLEGPAKEALTRLASARRNARPTIDDDGSESDGGVSAIAGSRADESGLRWLADAAMVLSDPPVFHLLLHETARSDILIRSRIAFPALPQPATAAPAKVICAVWRCFACLAWSPPDWGFVSAATLPALGRCARCTPSWRTRAPRSRTGTSATSPRRDQKPSELLFPRSANRRAATAPATRTPNLPPASLASPAHLTPPSQTLPQLVELALSAHRLLLPRLRGKSAARVVDTALPAVHSDVLEKFFPLVADKILEALCRDEDEVGSMEARLGSQSAMCVLCAAFSPCCALAASCCAGLA